MPHIPTCNYSPDAEDPDLDLLLADLCKLEEDTKAQLASSSVQATNSSNTKNDPGLPPLR